MGQAFYFATSVLFFNKLKEFPPSSELLIKKTPMSPIIIIIVKRIIVFKECFVIILLYHNHKMLKHETIEVDTEATPPYPPYQYTFPDTGCPEEVSGRLFFLISI